MIARSATPVTVVLVVAVLLAGLGSGVVAVTLALFSIVPAWACAWTTTVMTAADAPEASAAARVHVTDTLPLFVQTQPVPVAEVNVTPAGSVSRTDNPEAEAGPLFVTVSW